MLPVEDLDVIDYWRKTNTYGTNYADIEEVLKPWESNKAHLYKLLGEKLIIERDIEYKSSFEESIEALDNLLHTSQFYNDLYASLRQEKEFYSIMNLFNQEVLYNNRWDYNTKIFILSNGKKIRFEKGAKTLRLINKLAKCYNVPGFDDFATSFSRITNQKYIHGRLCISIHPLDYMTMSDNECDWDSCMSWSNAGDYRQGTIEMMNSPYVVVAYLRASDDMHLGSGHYWNNKKWRELYIVHPELITNIKGYPYENENLTAAVVDILRELAETNTSWKEWEKRESFKSIYMNHMFNDYTRTEFHYSYVYPKGYSNYIEVSGPNQCMCCGNTHSIPEAHMLICPECEGLVQCAECGEWVENYLTTQDEVNYCRYCYNNTVIMSSYSLEDYSENAITPHYVKLIGMSYTTTFFVSDDDYDDPAFTSLFCNNKVPDLITEEYLTPEGLEWFKEKFDLY